MLRKGTLFFLFNFFLAMVSGQDDFLALSGKVNDAKSHNGVPSASIQLKSVGTGTFTNSSGAFVFKIPKSALGDSLVISCIGYKTFSIPVRTAMNSQQFTLEPSAIEYGAFFYHVAAIETSGHSRRQVAAADTTVLHGRPRRECH